MKKVDYFKIIQKYIKPNSLAYRFYIPHVTLVTAKALAAARRINLSKKQLQFIEEAGMLHDIGIIKVKDSSMGCAGKLSYEQHLIEGKKMLEKENLPKHALVCERHTSITKNQIIKNSIDLPPQDYTPQTIEEELIAWADKFYNKVESRLFTERGVKEIRAKYKTYGKEALGMFDAWNKKFGE